MRTTYARRLGLFDGTMPVIGGIIGAGIFLNPAIAAARTGSARGTLLVWGLGGVVALIGAMCFGELGARRPKAGGSYVYLREVFGPLPAFLYGWTRRTGGPRLPDPGSLAPFRIEPRPDVSSPQW